MQHTTLVGSGRKCLSGAGLGADAGTVRVIAASLLKRQLGLTDLPPFSPKEFAAELSTFNGGDKAQILSEFRAQGGDPLFISKVQSLLPGVSGVSSLRSNIMLGVGTGLAGLVVGVVVGRATKR